MKSLEIQETPIGQPEEMSGKASFKVFPRRQSSVRREIIVEGEFCKWQILFD